MEQLVDSIKRNGVMTPATVRLKEDGRYELISGHRRKKACELAGLETLKCEVKLGVCELCGENTGDICMHHVKSLKSIKYNINSKSADREDRYRRTWSSGASETVHLEGFKGT